MSLHTKLKSIIKPAVIIPSTLLFLTLTSALILLSSNSNADTTSATASVTVPDTCYMSSTSTTHTDSVSGGTYTENFGGESTVTVTCNDRNGYSVYAVGYSNDVEGTNGLIGTSTGLVIPSGTSTSTNVSNWAMKLTPGTGTYAPTILNGYNNYSLVPTTATKVATLTSDINVSNSSQFKTSYAVSVAPTQAADTYVGKVKYTVVHPNYSNADGTLESYTVTLGFTYADSIIIDGVSYTSSSTAPSLSHGTHTISGTYPEGFSSWSSTGGITITSASSASTTINVTGAGTLTLTGQEPAPGQCTSTATCMQTYAFSSCTASGDTLTDARDGNTYTVKKIGNLCWMTANLKITGTISASLSNFTGNDVNITVNSLASGNTYTEARSTLSTNASYPGAYYNYCAASAGTICTSSNSTEASSDICPSGWRLPTNAEFGTIGTSSGSKTNVSAFSPIYSGLYQNGSLSLTGSYGYWWSSTASSTIARYLLNYYSGKLYSDYSLGTRQIGFPVRCVKSS